jgi:hypothetical protein
VRPLAAITLLLALAASAPALAQGGPRSKRLDYPEPASPTASPEGPAFQAGEPPAAPEGGRPPDERSGMPMPPPAPELVPSQPRPGSAPRREFPLPRREEKEKAGIFGRILPPYPVAEGYTFVPIPIFYTNPNIGTGFGIMPILLYHPERRIEVIAAPSIDYNRTESLAFTSRIFWYPTLREELFVFNSVSLEGQMDQEARFHGHGRFFPEFDFTARGYLYVDGTRRFFGMGAGTQEADETNYEQSEIGVEGDFGYLIWDTVRLGVTTRYRRTSTDDGIVRDLPSTLDVFPGVPGVGAKGVDALAIGGHITFDLRDSRATPTRGVFLDVFGEAAPKGLISDFAFWRWIVDARVLLPVVTRRWTHVMRATWHGVSADDETPFWELPTLGGANNLRGFGLGRFTDENYLLFSAEERFRIFELTVERNRLILEVAGFLDAGRVYGRGGGLGADDWQFVPGAGVRMLLPDSGIVARGDFGYGSEGLAAFIVLGYPF